MIPANFDYIQADSAEAAIQAIAEHGDEAKLVAGGHSLIPLMKFRLATPAYLVDCLLYTSPSPRDRQKSRMPSSA